MFDAVRQLRALGVKTSVVSNADPRICQCPPFHSYFRADGTVKTLESLGILPMLTHPPTLSWDVEASKPSPLIYQAACKSCGEDAGDGIIMVGDELKACVVSPGSSGNAEQSGITSGREKQVSRRG